MEGAGVGYWEPCLTDSSASWCFSSKLALGLSTFKVSEAESSAAAENFSDMVEVERELATAVEVKRKGVLVLSVF